jgi:hypothetical protein
MTASGIWCRAASKRFSSSASRIFSNWRVTSSSIPFARRWCAIRADYAWSSYRATAGLGPAPEWLEVGWILDRFTTAAGTRADQCEAYRRFVSEARDAEYNPWDWVVGQIYLGSAQFCDRMQALVAAAPRSAEHPRPQRRFVQPSFDAVIEAVARGFNESPAAIRQRSHRVTRKAVAQLASEESGLTFAAIGGWLGITGAAAAYLARESKQIEQSDPVYAALLRSIRRDLAVPESEMGRPGM